MTKLTLSEFADRLNAIMPVMLKEFARRQVSDITLPQFLILQLLYKEDELKMTSLAHFMGVTTAAMTGIVDRLVKGGFAQRNYDPDDRRVIKIKLTSKGNKLVKKINQHRRRMIIRIFSKISTSDRQDYLRILSRVKDTLTQESSGIK